MIKKIFYSLAIISVMLFCNIILSGNMIFAKDFIIENDRGDKDLSENFSGKSQIFELKTINDGNDKIIEGEFSLQKVMKNNFILHSKGTFGIKKDILNKLSVGDNLIFNIYKNVKDERLNIEKTFNICDKFRFEKPKLKEPTKREQEYMNKIVGIDIEYDDVDMYKLISKNSNTIYYLPITNEEYVSILHDERDAGYDINIDYNVKYDKNVKFYELIDKYDYVKNKWCQNYVDRQLAIDEFKNTFSKIYKLKFNNKNELIAVYFKKVVYGGV